MSEQKITFNPENKELLTYSETLSPAMNITTQENADEYLKDYIEYIKKQLEKEPRKDNMTAEQIVKTNLGYYAGYYDNETRRRVERLFRCTHPFFGSVEEHIPTVEEAYNLGVKVGSRNRKS